MYVMLRKCDMMQNMARKVTSPQFIEWLDRQLDLRHWNDSQASKLAGLDKSAISAIRNGINPGPKRVMALAHLFGYPENEALRLAGHILPTPSDNRNVAEETRYKLGKIAEIISHLPPDIQSETLDHMIAVLQIVHRAGQDQGEKEKESSDKR